jgi:hypothetical protein
LKLVAVRSQELICYLPWIVIVDFQFGVRSIVEK